jgi:PIN domain nuclease of toxin-antitoxin system
LESEIVFDSSAVLAILKRERGIDRALAVLDKAAISCVNLAEVQTKLIEAGFDRHSAWARIEVLGFRAYPFNKDQAFEAGSLVAVTRPFGLSLGDRACLALAIERNATVYTTDRSWKNLSLGIEVEVIR